jgi:hypothetical protein
MYLAELSIFGFLQLHREKELLKNVLCLRKNFICFSARTKPAYTYRLTTMLKILVNGYRRYRYVQAINLQFTTSLLGSILIKLY